jgi:hypothetical protein
MVLPAYALPALEIGVKAVRNEGNLILDVDTVSHLISPRIAVGSLSNTTSYSLRMFYKQFKLG